MASNMHYGNIFLVVYGPMILPHDFIPQKLMPYHLISCDNHKVNPLKALNSLRIMQCHHPCGTQLSPLTALPHPGIIPQDVSGGLHDNDDPMGWGPSAGTVSIASKVWWLYQFTYFSTVWHFHSCILHWTQDMYTKHSFDPNILPTLPG